MHKNKYHSGFTIIELVVVIVVIGILAALSYFSISAWRDQIATDVLKSDLTNAAAQLKSDLQWKNILPETKEATNGGKGLPTSEGTTFQYTRISDKTYCLTATSNRKGVPAMMITNASTGPQEGACVGHQDNDGNVVALTMQNFTPSQCAALTVYNGSNEEAIQTAEDTRGGTKKMYRIAKLADNKCWMLDNLKLGSADNTVTLTPSDSDVVTNFTLPKLSIPSVRSAVDPQVVGPVPGDTGAYGYLYNWSAAVATTSPSYPAGSTAPSSVCAKGWRLPTGGLGGTFDYTVLDKAFGGTGAVGKISNSASWSSWQAGGAFKGLLAGQWGYGNAFVNQGSRSYWWTSSVVASGNAYHISFDNSPSPKDPLPGSAFDQAYALRCVLR